MRILDFIFILVFILLFRFVLLFDFLGDKFEFFKITIAVGQGLKYFNELLLVSWASPKKRLDVASIFADDLAVMSTLLQINISSPIKTKKTRKIQSFKRSCK